MLRLWVGWPVSGKIRPGGDAVSGGGTWQGGWRPRGRNRPRI